MTQARNGRPAVSLALATAIAVSALPMGIARAELVTTDRAIERHSLVGERARVATFLAREDVREQMADMGIDADEASKRVGSMSDAEIAQIAGKIDAIPAGQARGGSLVLVLLLVVLILLLI